MGTNKWHRFALNSLVPNDNDACVIP